MKLFGFVFAFSETERITRLRCVCISGLQVLRHGNLRGQGVFPAYAWQEKIAKQP